MPVLCNLRIDVAGREIEQRLRAAIVAARRENPVERADLATVRTQYPLHPRRRLEVPRLHRCARADQRQRLAVGAVVDVRVRCIQVGVEEGVEIDRIGRRGTIGLQAGGDGVIGDIDRNGAPYKAGMVPGMKIVKVNGKKWSAGDVKKLLAAAKPGQQLVLDTEYAGVAQAFHVPAGAGLRYPHLQRIAGTPDSLTAYLAPHAVIDQAASK